MYEGFASFDDYVRSYGLERSEGVLLRYLSQVYKTMAETVPVAARTEEVMDILAHFRALLRDVDTSLIEEWESLTQPGRRAAGPRGRAPGRRSGGRAAGAERRDPRRAAQAACARWRARDYAAAVRAAGAGRRASLDGRATDRGDGAVLGGAHRAADDARRAPPDRTRIDELGPGRLRVQQTLVDAEGDEDWSLDCVVDVRAGGRAGDHRCSGSGSDGGWRQSANARSTIGAPARRSAGASTITSSPTRRPSLTSASSATSATATSRRSAVPAAAGDPDRPVAVGAADQRPAGTGNTAS